MEGNGAEKLGCGAARVGGGAHDGYCVCGCGAGAHDVEGGAGLHDVVGGAGLHGAGVTGAGAGTGA